MSTVLSIDLSINSHDNKGLFIEQGEPDPGDGYLSRAGMFRALLALADNEPPEEDVQCTDDIGTMLYVYRYDLTQQYTLKITRGNLGSRTTADDETFTQKIQFNMDDSASLKYPNFGVLDKTWLGKRVWDIDGGVTSAPTTTTTIDEVKLSKKIYGTLLLTYKINRDAYGCRLIPRDEAEENKYSSVAYADCDDGVKWLELKAPEGVEETGLLCKGGYGNLKVVPPPGDKPPPSAPHKNARKVYDYCTGEVLVDDTKK